MASSRSSGYLTSNTLLATGTNRINAVSIFTDGTNDAQVTIRDGTTISGTILVQGKCLGPNQFQHIVFQNPVYFEQGLYVQIDGQDAASIVYYGG